MTSLLDDLLLDLKRRGDYVLLELDAAGRNLPEDFQLHKSGMFDRVKRAVATVEQMLRDPDLSDPQLEPNFFIVYKRLSELILNVEDSTLLILKRYSDDDRFLSSLIRQMCREVGYEDPPPLCGALSFQYFQALVGMDIIMTPQTQAYELLSLPDLYHELSHFVVFRQRDAFEVPVLALIHGFFAELMRKGRQRGLPQASLQSIRESHALWAAEWKVEFMCDMIATYWCGPAYGWANVRLSATRGDPYQEGFSHPADDARWGELNQC